MKIDTPTLAQIIDRCFDLSMDGAVSAADQASYLAQGKRLRGLMLNLITARFNQGTDKLQAANAQLAQVNTLLQSRVGGIIDVVTALANVAKLVAALDQLLEIVASVL